LAPQSFDSSLFCGFDDFELLHPEARSQIAVNLREVQSLSWYRAVAGHFSLPTLLQIANAPSISTVLREPRARLLSLYMYWRTPGLGDFWAPYRVTQHARRPLSAFLSEPRLAPAVDNQVCRMLLHGDPRLPESGFAVQSDIQAIAADAIALLDTLGFVGVMELGDSAWRGVARLFNVTLEQIKVNMTGELVSLTAIGPGETLLTADALDLIEQRSAADLLVYDHALTRAGLDARERRRLSDGASAHQLVKLGDLVGHSAAQAAKQTRAVGVLRSQLEEQRRSHAELNEMHELEVQGLKDEVRRRDEDLERLRSWLDPVHEPARHGSAIPAHELSLLAGWSVGQVWGCALILSSIIAATDAILTHVVLIALLAVGPFCGLLTGRWARTATAGIWAVVLAVLLGLPDEIWDTGTQLLDVGAVAAVALLSTFAATLVERRRFHEIR